MSFILPDQFLLIKMRKIRLITLIAISIITPLGFASKFYAGPNSKWFNDSLGGSLYVIFWCLLFLFIFIKSKPWKIALAVFVITCILEFLQLWHPPFLQIIRATFIGRTILGTTFVPSDFIYYLLGSIASWLLLEKIKKITDS